MEAAHTHDHAHGHGHGEHAHHPGGIMRWVMTTNHKDIGTLYLIFSLTMFFVGGILALMLRAELFDCFLQTALPCEGKRRPAGGLGERLGRILLTEAAQFSDGSDEVDALLDGGGVRILAGLQRQRRRALLFAALGRRVGMAARVGGPRGLERRIGGGVDGYAGGLGGNENGFELGFAAAVA